jgi:methionyl-tRNA formyltransferase
MNLLLIGEDAAGVRTLQSLQQSNHRIVSVMSSPSRPGGARTSLWSLATKLGYTTWPSQLVKDANFAKQIRDHQVDMILNVHSLYVICKEVLEAPVLGSYNLHPGPLPRYAGLNSICWAIYRGEKTHGVSLHRMEPEIDTGAIVSKEVFELADEETGLSLTAKCVNIGVGMIQRFLDAVERNPSTILEHPQDLTKREYFGREVPENGNLSWHYPAKRIFNFIRACDFVPFRSPWGHPRTALRGCELGIVRARLTGKPVEACPGTVGLISDLGVEVACADQWILVQQVLKGGKHFSAVTMLKSGEQLQSAQPALSGDIIR